MLVLYSFMMLCSKIENHSCLQSKNKWFFFQICSVLYKSQKHHNICQLRKRYHMSHNFNFEQKTELLSFHYQLLHSIAGKQGLMGKCVVQKPGATMWMWQALWTAGITEERVTKVAISPLLNWGSQRKQSFVSGPCWRTVSTPKGKQINLCLWAWLHFKSAEQSKKEVGIQYLRFYGPQPWIPSFFR